MARKIAILGTATATLPQAPVEDESWEIWATGVCDIPVPRVDRRFELHSEAGLRKNSPDYYEWLKEQNNTNVWAFNELSGVRLLHAYPKEDVIVQFGTWFLTSTVAWMVALATHEILQEPVTDEPARIGLWGVDMGEGTEYAYQKPGCLHFLRLALMAGINITVPPDSELNMVPLPYPDNYENPDVLRLREREATTLSEIAGAQQGLDAYQKALHELNGKLALVRSLMRQCGAPAIIK